MPPLIILGPQQAFTRKSVLIEQERGSFYTYSPEFDEILDDCSTNYYTVEWGVGQEQHKVFVVRESDTVIHPERKHQAKWNALISLRFL